MSLFLSLDFGVKFDRAVLFDREIHLISNAKFCAKANNDNNKTINQLSGRKTSLNLARVCGSDLSTFSGSQFSDSDELAQWEIREMLHPLFSLYLRGVWAEWHDPAYWLQLLWLAINNSRSLVQPYYTCVCLETKTSTRDIVNQQVKYVIKWFQLMVFIVSHLIGDIE